MAHVNDMLAVVCHTPLLEESSIAPTARVRAVAFRMNTPQTTEGTGSGLDWLQSLTYLPSSGMYTLMMSGVTGKWGVGGRSGISQREILFYRLFSPEEKEEITSFQPHQADYATRYA
jgi:hypothetical protein